jgi:uncharacterized protein
MGIGFGLERIGLAARRFPLLFTIALLLLSGFAAFQLPQVRFDGNVTAILPEETKAYQEFFDQKLEFRDSARDVTMLIRSSRLDTAEGLEALRALHLEMSLNDHVSSVLSVFSLPDPDRRTGEIGQFFPTEIVTDRQAADLLADLRERFPQAGRLIATDSNLAVMVVALDSSLLQSDGASYEGFRAIRETAAEAAPDEFEILFTGMTPIGATIVGALVSDQVKLTLVGLLLGTAIAFYIFRSVLAAIVCAIPPGLTALWTLGLFGFMQTPINYLTTVLPTLALVLAFADGIVLYFRWQTLNAEKPDFDGNLIAAIRRVGPASSLTSITTVLAFLSFSFASGSALKTFSLLGMCVVTLAFLSVIVAMPLAIHWAITSGLAGRSTRRAPVFAAAGGGLNALVAREPLWIAIAAVIAVAGLSIVHAMVGPEFRITDYLPKTSETRQAEVLTNEIVGGRSPVFLSVPMAEPGAPLAPANRERLDQAHAILAESFEAERIFSIESLAETMLNETALLRLEQQFAEAPPSAQANFISRDRDAMLVTVYIPSDQAIAETRAQIAQVRASLEKLDWGDNVTLTGFDVLMADEFTRLVEQLRTSLLIAILLGVAIIGIASRSPILAVAAITPNLLPIFVVELAIWAKGGTVNLSEVIALTIAFGIAIDNAVHVINLYCSERANGRSTTDAVAVAVGEVGPALGASTAIICVSFLVTQLSILPVVPVLGRLMIATLIVAYIANLVILPANILTLSRFIPTRQASGRVAERS